ncbi:MULTISPECIES: CBS domain-containing protein [Nitratiruptor]|uniref:Predicted signal-transduction protein containing cAMP-binding and CBS domains n=1 Tax=Nitratiruptor tergarcus DSM 16512 TaxID=1069081 RepID=A0A1W1WTY0_9BACT|nr:MULTISPECIES: CBS domain-containing protein [Nitratiruptor]BCD62327.1 hypothetical protein NitYY0813_C1201 [Nitratiruptor sp. YY08-13]BCD66263.1 hypothetical protein NitYY0826_C1203 [Nitratiruptor sp. YY08-26]SMC09737.1 Predicted signal-transduction protein containing cAMP-binding and CBS domains [Nitratiruptor tergarcus DSM 16512]
MLVEEIMTPKEKLIIVDQLDSVRKALELMKKHNIKSVIVDKNSPNGAYGLLTFKNILQAIVAQEGDIDLLNVYDIATIPAISVTRKLEMRYVAKMMVSHSIKRVLVVDDNELYGIITMSDIIGVLLEDI